MAITIHKPLTLKSYLKTEVQEPKFYLFYIIHDKYISWEFCMRMLIEVFHKSYKNAEVITEEILIDGEGLCGIYMLEIAETKAELIEKQAKKEGFSLSCLIEEV